MPSPITVACRARCRAMLLCRARRLWYVLAPPFIQLASRHLAPAAAQASCAAGTPGVRSLVPPAAMTRSRCVAETFAARWWTRVADGGQTRLFPKIIRPKVWPYNLYNFKIRVCNLCGPISRFGEWVQRRKKVATTRDLTRLTETIKNLFHTQPTEPTGASSATAPGWIELSEVNRTSPGGSRAEL